MNYIGFIKGWDSTVYIGLMARLRNNGIIVRKRPVVLTQTASNEALYKGVWLIDAGITEEYAIQQSTGFAWSSFGLVAAAHAVGEYDKSGAWTKYDFVQVRQPHLGDGKVYPAKVLKVHPHSDLALIEYPFAPLVTFGWVPGQSLAQRDVVRILGFRTTILVTPALIRTSR